MRQANARFLDVDSLLGIFQELSQFAVWIYDLQTDNFDAQGIIERSVEELLENQLIRKEKKYNTYFISYYNEPPPGRNDFPHWEIWFHIAETFGQIEHFEQSTKEVMEEIIDGQLRIYARGKFPWDKVRKWERTFGIELKY